MSGFDAETVCQTAPVTVSAVVTGQVSSVTVFFRRDGNTDSGQSALAPVGGADWAARLSLPPGKYTFTVAAVGPNDAASGESHQVALNC